MVAQKVANKSLKRQLLRVPLLGFPFSGPAIQTEGRTFVAVFLRRGVAGGGFSGGLGRGG